MYNAYYECIIIIFVVFRVRNIVENCDGTVRKGQTGPVGGPGAVDESQKWRVRGQAADVGEKFLCAIIVVVVVDDDDDHDRPGGRSQVTAHPSATRKILESL